jgi:hypothetical protein
VHTQLLARFRDFVGARIAANGAMGVQRGNIPTRPAREGVHRSKRGWPSPRPMQKAKDRYQIAGDAIGGNVWRPSDHQFAGAADTTKSSDIGV